MNSITAPSFAPASFTNFAISAVRSVKPRPDVCTVSSEDTIVVARTVEGAVREIDLSEVMRAQNRRVGKGALRAVPTICSGEYIGGHVSLCPPYEVITMDPLQILPVTSF